MPRSASTVSSDFTDFLKELAQAKGKTLTTVAKNAGISTGYMSNLLTGRKSSPSLDICGRLADALRCTLDERRTLLQKAGHDPEEAAPPPVVPPKVVTAKISEIPRPKKVSFKINDGFLHLSKTENTLLIEAQGAIGSLVASIELEGLQIAQVPISVQGLYKFSGFDPGASLRIQIIEPNGNPLFDGTL